MDRFKELVPSDVRDILAATVVTVGGTMVVLKVTSVMFGWISKTKMERRWRDTPKDVVILHRVPPAFLAPNASPFVLKLETYLRMAEIPYQIDFCDAMGPSGKTPWITLNGQHIPDSQLCIEFLAKKFEKRIGTYSDEQRAVSTLARIAMDEHFYWGLIIWRYIHSPAKGFGPEKVFGMPSIFLKLVLFQFIRFVKTAAWIQGLARHPEEQIVQIISDDLKALSKVLGKKKFILGDEPCEDDCAIFGEVAQALWCTPGSPYEKLLNEELTNLKEYCLRMKDLYWQDWDECIAQKKLIKE